MSVISVISLGFLRKVDYDVTTWSVLHYACTGFEFVGFVGFVVAALYRMHALLAGCRRAPGIK